MTKKYIYTISPIYTREEPARGYYRILYLFYQADSGLIPLMVLTRQSLYNTLFFFSCLVFVFLRCVALRFFLYFSFLFLSLSSYSLQEAALLFFSTCLEFSLAFIFIVTSFLKRRVFWALELFWREGWKGGGEGRELFFFVIFFFFAFLGIF
ncbi:hypothetical protein LI328DRAFT_118571 [Trichoderma asperelloides]|nr:hypothetical protein LI328DRAFT_118571 [Trichoderma asperelloides]